MNCLLKCSDMRQVPDNQEVFVNPVTDQSIIIELLDYLEEEDESAIRLFNFDTSVVQA